MERVTVAEFHELIRRQLKDAGVEGGANVAFRCPACGTLQSGQSLVQAGGPVSEVEKLMGFSCEGRISGSGPPPRKKVGAAHATNLERKRWTVRGCNWTLGGLFKIHQLTVVTEDGKEHPHFALATVVETLFLKRMVDRGLVAGKNRERWFEVPSGVPDLLTAAEVWSAEKVLKLLVQRSNGELEERVSPLPDGGDVKLWQVSRVLVQDLVRKAA